MSNRAWLKSVWLWIGVAACSLAIAANWAVPRDSSINLDNFRRIQTGITVERVSDILQHAVGDYPSDGASTTLGGENWGEFRSGRNQYWISNDGRI